MFIVTLLSAVLCGAPANLPDGECASESSLWEANSYTEADADWNECLLKRAVLIKGRKYESVECDQFDPNAKVTM